MLGVGARHGDNQVKSVRITCLSQKPLRFLRIRTVDCLAGRLIDAGKGRDHVRSDNVALACKDELVDGVSVHRIADGLAYPRIGKGLIAGGQEHALHQVHAAFHDVIIAVAAQGLHLRFGHVAHDVDGARLQIHKLGLHVRHKLELHLIQLRESLLPVTVILLKNQVLAGSVRCKLKGTGSDGIAHRVFIGLRNDGHIHVRKELGITLRKSHHHSLVIRCFYGRDNRKCGGSALILRISIE